MTALRSLNWEVRRSPLPNSQLKVLDWIVAAACFIRYHKMKFYVDDVQKQEMLVTYASLILHDDGADITEEGIMNLITAAGATVESYWPSLFVKLLKGRDIDALLLTAGSVGGGSAGGGAGVGAGATEQTKETAAAEPTPDSAEEDEGDMGFSLFD
jgi:large subunit ribosomal protein LP1